MANIHINEFPMIIPWLLAMSIAIFDYQRIIMDFRHRTLGKLPTTPVDVMGKYSHFSLVAAVMAVLATVDNLGRCQPFIYTYTYISIYKYINRF